MIHGAQWLGIALLVAGCSATPVYRVGIPSDLTEGRIVTSRVVPIAGYEPEAGPIAGAMIGAALGPLGGLVGAGMGYLVEWWTSGSGEGVEYLVVMDDGRVVTVVVYRDDAERPLPAGTPVRVETGGALPTRVVELTEAERGGARSTMGSGWTNPDDVAGSGLTNPDAAAPPDELPPPPEAADPPPPRPG